MSKIIGIIISFLLSLNSQKIVFLNRQDEKKDNREVYGIQIHEDIISTESEIQPSKYTTSISSDSNWWSYPEDLRECSRAGDDLLVLVNKEYRLPSTYVPFDLVSASLSGIRRGEKFELRNIVINDLKNLVYDANRDGIDLSIRSGYRSFNTQINTYNYWLKANGGNVGATDTISARAGHSQHQLGTVVDFSSSEIQDGIGGQFASTDASKWLAENAWKYGFVIAYPAGYEATTGYSYESWHYRYIGKENAKEMINSGMILELYLRSKN